MALKDILVHVDGGPTSRARLALAGELARRHGARLAALYGVEPAGFADFLAPTDASYLDLTRRLEEQHRATMLAAAARMEEIFRAETERLGIHGDWRIEEGPVSAVVTRHARCVDLVVLGQIDPDRRPPGGGVAPAEVVLAAGRPVLVVPYAGSFDGVGRRAVIAWNASREAARAVADALPLIADAEAVTVLTIGPPAAGDDDPASATALVGHLLRHGIRAKAENEVADDISVGDLILSRAADLGADLVVMGAYGHSRTRELLLGGATRNLLQHMTVPVLMAH